MYVYIKEKIIRVFVDVILREYTQSVYLTSSIFVRIT